MIDLDQWAQRQHTKLRWDADIAMWRLSQQHNWGIPHPGVVAFSKSMIEIRKAFVGMGDVVKRQIDIVKGMLDAVDQGEPVEISLVGPRTGKTQAIAHSMAFTPGRDT